MEERITKEEVIHIMELAKLEFNDQELEKMKRELNCFLLFMDSLKDVDTDGVVVNEIMSSNLNRFRKDEIKDFENIEGILKNRENNLVANMIQIPDVIKGEE